jgi:hypothetical protein
VAGWAATIAYNCGHERIWPPYKAQAEIWRAIGRRPCPDCRQPWSPPEPGTVYRLALAVGGVPLTAWRWPCLDLCWHHSAEATAKGVEIPKGIECRVGCIVPTRNTDLMLCDVCEGNVAIVPDGRATVDTRGEREHEHPASREDGPSEPASEAQGAHMHALARRPGASAGPPMGWG